jgi:hypothetical protein
MSRVALWPIAILCASISIAPAAAELRDSYTPVTIVALGPIEEPDDYVLLNAGPGKDDARAISLARGAPAQPSFAQAMAGQDLHLGEELRTAIAEALLTKRLKVVPANGEKAHYRLDVAIPVHTVTYSDTAKDDSLVPGFVVLVMVRDMRTGEIRARDRIVYGRTDIESAHTLDSDERFRFASEDALLADPKTAADGLRAGVTAVAKEIAGILSR